LKRVPDEGIEQYCKDVERAKIYEAWEKYLATKGGDALQNRAAEVKERVSEFMHVIESKAESLKNEKQSRHETLTTPAMLANSQDTKEYFEKTIRKVRESLAELLNVSKTANSDIAKSLIVATQEDALLDWEIREGGKVDALANSIIEGIQQMVYERLDSQDKLYTTLSALLNSAEVRMSLRRKVL
jgi:flagellar biosynthesis GTPase FlhF